MIRKAFGASIAALLLVMAVAPAKAVVITTYGTNFILVQDTLTNRTWGDADSYAQTNFSTRLATIDTAAKQAEAISLVSGLALFAPVWTGYNQLGGPGWAWADGTPAGFENWGPGAPNSGDTAAYMQAGTLDGNWYSTSDLNTYGAFLINVTDFVPSDPPTDPPTGIAAPGALALLAIGVLVLARRETILKGLRR